MYVPFSLFFFNCLQLSGTPNLGLFLTNVLGQQMARTRRLSETDGARAFSSLCGLCIFLHPRTHANAPKNSHPLRALIALSSRPVPILFPPCSVSRRPFFPISLARVVCTVFRFGRETMKSLSPMAIATNADRISRNRRPFLFLLLSLYINIYIFFFVSLVYTGAFAAFTANVAPLTATCWQQQHARRLDKIFPILYERHW